jgi:hypothetical protein
VHRLCGDAEALRAVLSGRAVLVDQPQVEFMDERGGAKWSNS